MMRWTFTKPVRSAVRWKTSDRYCLLLVEEIHLELNGNEIDLGYI